jgi:hypothetical protein
MPEYIFDVLDFSGIEPEDIEADLRDNNKKLNEYAAGGWKVISLVPYKAEKENQFLVLLGK